MTVEEKERTKKKDKKKDDKKKDKKGKGDAAEEVKEVPPPLTGPSQLTMLMHASIKTYEGKWATIDEEDNFAQKYDMGMEKGVVRPKVYKELTKEVDTMLLDQLKNVQLQ